MEDDKTHIDSNENSNTLLDDVVELQNIELAEIARTILTNEISRQSLGSYYRLQKIRKRVLQQKVSNKFQLKFDITIHDAPTKQDVTSTRRSAVEPFDAGTPDGGTPDAGSGSGADAGTLMTTEVRTTTTAARFFRN